MDSNSENQELDPNYFEKIVNQSSNHSLVLNENVNENENENLGENNEIDCEKQFFEDNSNNLKDNKADNEPKPKIIKIEPKIISNRPKFSEEMNLKNEIEMDAALSEKQFSLNKSSSDRTSISDREDTKSPCALNNLQEMLQEDEEVYEYLLESMRKKLKRKDKVGFASLVDAMRHEIRIRNAEKYKDISILRKKHQQLVQKKSQVNSTREIEAQELHNLKQMNQIKLFRHSGNNMSKSVKEYIQKSGNMISHLSSNDDSQDWQIDIELMTDVIKHGWFVEFSKKFQSTLTQNQRKSLISMSNGQYTESPNCESNESKSPKWAGAVVAVVGLQDKGKTFILNAITGCNLPSGKKIATKGLSFKHVDMEEGTKLILLDTAGSYSPVRVTSELSVAEKEATELFLLDLVYDLSDQFVFVVNDFTSLDQRYLDKLSRSLQNSATKTFREIIVVHNMKEVDNAEILDHLWESQVTKIQGRGSIQRTKVAAVNPISGVLQEKHVNWFKTEFSRHICIANADSLLGLQLNPWAISLLRQWLKAVFVPVNRDLSVVESVMKFSYIKLTHQFRTPIQIRLQNTEEETKQYITTDTQNTDSMRVPQINIDTHGFITTCPDSFVPPVDIFAGEFQEIWLDMPGLRLEDIEISRQNVTTIIRGKRICEFSMDSSDINKQERKFGEFLISFRIPEIQERKWAEVYMNDGILHLKYKKDSDDNESSEN